MASQEYISVLRKSSRVTEQVPYTSALEPMGSPKEQRKYMPPRPQRKAELLNGQILSFSDIADFYSDCVPISARVYGGGFYGVGGELTIAENETLYVHCVLKTDIAKAELSHNRKYNVPLNFIVPFGIVYNPSNSIDKAREGYNFDSVESILSEKELPKVVRMECNAIDTAGRVVNEGEILIVKGTPAPKQLNVYSISTGTVSTLCKGSFSANPSLIKMSLQQIHQFAYDLLPCQVVLCCEDFPNMNIPTHLASSVFTIKEFSSYTTLLVTGQLDADISKLQVSELPGDLQFQIQITGTETWSSLAKTAKAISDSYPHLPVLYQYLGMPNEKMRQGQLFFYEAGTRPVLENEYEIDRIGPADDAYVEITRPTAGPPSPSLYNMLSHINTSIPGDECQAKQLGNASVTPGNDYITLFPAPPLYQRVLDAQPSQGCRPVQPVPQPQPKKRSQISSYTAVPVMPPQHEPSQLPTLQLSQPPTSQPLPSQLSPSYPSPCQPPTSQPLPSTPKIVPRPRPQPKLPPSIPDMKNSVPESFAPVVAPMTALSQVSTDTSDTVTQLTLDMLRLKQEWSDMKCKMSRVLEMIGQFPDKPGFTCEDRTNRAQQTLSIDDVVALLQAAGLEQYATVFRTETIDGDIFCELDEQTLETELCVTSKLHRLRLMKLIRKQRLLELRF